MISRTYSLPAELEAQLSHALSSRFRLSLTDSRPLASAIKQLSDFFILNPQGQTPWHENWAQIAYLSYFLPLNFLRVQAVVDEARAQEFFAGLKEVIDFGAGLGTASLALRSDFSTFHLVEKSLSICSAYSLLPSAGWSERAPKVRENSMAVFSYSLTELDEIPAWAQHCEALMILEPATQQDGRRLLQWRQQLLERGYFAWAPCTHQQACPLLTQSKTDWCHDRILFSAPDWFLALEEHLPMRNRSLTMSYLLMRRTPPPARDPRVARTVGDLLREKGKDRQMICRGPEREFLAWMHKHGEHVEFPRGVLMEIPGQATRVSNEVRWPEPTSQ